MALSARIAPELRLRGINTCLWARYAYINFGAAEAAGGLRLVFVLDHCDRARIALGFDEWRARSGDDGRNFFVSAG